MGRVLLFVFGIALGAAGMYLLFANGTLRVAGPLPVEGVPTANAPTPEPTIERPPLPTPPAPQLAPAAPSTIAPLTAPVAEAAPAAALTPVPASSASVAGPNASEQPAAHTTEGVAAVTAATTVPASGLPIPVEGVQASQLVDTYTQSRGAGRLHDAIDIMAARGTPVHAVVDGRIAKLFLSKPGGITAYQFDRDEKICYYYAHLDRYAPGLAEGAVLKRGDLIGYVGSTGNASPDAPHLHFAVMVLGPEKKWWQGTAVNPYPLLGGR